MDSNEVETIEEVVTFKSLGVVDVICEECEKLKWEAPTRIQREAIPIALQGRDIIGLAETGSGKTGAFAIPVLQALLKTPQRFFALVLTPKRELAFQIAEQFEALGAGLGVKTAVIVGGIDMTTQSLALSKKPHIIIATPGYLAYHLENSKGFNLRALKFLVIDEPNRIFYMYDEEVDKILKEIPRERNTYLFSATMTWERASLNDPVIVEVPTKYQTFKNLLENYLFIPLEHKDLYLVHILNELPGNSIIVFCETCANSLRIAFLLRNLGLTAIPLHGKLSQAKRLGVLAKFKSKTGCILIATDVACRGLDIPHVDVVINFDIPSNPKDYVHRVGRTAHAGRGGNSITFICQFDIQSYLKIESLIERKLPLYPTKAEEVMILLDRVTEAQLMDNKTENTLKSKCAMAIHAILSEQDCNGIEKLGLPKTLEEYMDYTEIDYMSSIL